MASPFLEATSLSKTYRGSFGRADVHALENLSLSVDGGEIFGLLGPNGAGKTTFVKLVLGLVRPTTGTATLMGESVRNWRARRAIGYLPENHRFPEFLTAHQMLSLYGQLASLDKNQTRKQIDEVLELVGMRKWADVPIRKYSKGMMQRVGLAQALLGDPSVVFLDEPTDGVDPIGRREIRTVLLHLRDLGKTVFINSHLLSELEMMCSRVAIIDQGRLVREGTLDSLLSNSGAYKIRSTKIAEAVIDQVNEFKLLPAGAAGISERESNGTVFDTVTYQLKPVTRSRLNEIIDLVRSSGVEIESVTRSKDSLEELFVRSIATNETDANERGASR